MGSQPQGVTPCNGKRETAERIKKLSGGLRWHIWVRGRNDRQTHM